MTDTVRCGIPRVAPGAGRIELSNGSLAQQFIAAGIDDLAKYHVVRLLYQYPSLVADAAAYAACLGFHSTESTAALLDDLVAAGILVRQRGAGGALDSYGLAEGGEMRRRLFVLYGAAACSTTHNHVLSVLAGRSLEKAEARAKATKRTALVVRPS